MTRAHRLLYPSLLALVACGSARSPAVAPGARPAGSQPAGPARAASADATSAARPAACPHGLVLSAVRPAADTPALSARSLQAAFGVTSEISDATRLRRSDGLEILIAVVWRQRQNPDIAFVSRRGEAPYSAAVWIDPGPLLDADPVAAWTGEGDRFAVAWARGPYPFVHDLHVAIADPAGVISSRTLTTRADPEGLTMARSAGGLVIVYSPTSAGARSRRGVFVIGTDAAGAVVHRERLLSSDGLWPVAAANDDGSAVGIAYRLEGGALGFALVGADGRVRTPAALVDRHDDPAAGYRPLGIAYREGLFWIGTRVTFHVSVIVAAPGESRIVVVDPGGRAAPAVTLPASGESVIAAVEPETARGGARVRYADSAGRHELDVACRAEPPTAEELTPGPCDVRTEGWQHGRFVSFRGVFAARAVSSGWAVAHRPFVQEDGYRRLDDEARASRVRSDGASLWDVELGEVEGETGIAADDRSVAITWERDERAYLTLLDLATGAERGIYRLEHGSSRTANACVAPSDGGWLVAFVQEGPSQIVWISPEGRVQPRGELRDRWNGCALQRTASGFALAFTAAPRVSESNWIYTLGLDVRGAPQGEAVRIAGEGFARTPMLVARGRGAVLVWTGPVQRELVAQELDERGATVGGFREVARTYGMWGFGIGSSADGPEVIWASERGGVGRRRLCP